MMQFDRFHGMFASVLLALGACAAPEPDVTGTRYGAFARARLPEATSLLGRPLYAEPPGADLDRLQADLAVAQAALADEPQDPERIVWVGRRCGYLWRMREAIEVYTRGIREEKGVRMIFRSVAGSGHEVRQKNHPDTFFPRVFTGRRLEGGFS